MRIGVASDHRGYELKQRTVAQLEQLGHEVMDCGPENDTSVDYPDFARRVANLVSLGELDRGILICGTGIGMCIAANKFTGVRGAVCHDSVTARMSRLHNDANVLCLSAGLVSGTHDQMIAVWLETEFEGGRHARRLEKITDIEQSARSPEAGESAEEPIGGVSMEAD